VIIEILLIYIIYLTVIILGSYYVNLYLSKDQFTKDELKDIVPYLTKLWSRINNIYSMSIMMICIGAASLIGVLLPMLSQHWFLNSAIIFIVMFFTFPLAKKNFDIARITTGGSFSDTAMSIFVKYHSFILIGFGTGTATGIMYNWGVSKEINFLWFLVNLIVLTIMIGMVIKDINSQ
jgi:hypothetical protein